MRKENAASFVSLIAIFIANLAIADSPAAIPPDLIPMYGGLDRQADPILKGADDALIEGTTREFGSRRAASERFVAQGFRYYFVDDLAMAMRRFNQAWLLDPEYADVYYGFQAVLNDRQEFCEARKMGERAFELGLERKPEVLADAGRVHALCANQDASLDDATKSAYIKKSSEYYTQALLLQPKSSYVYGSWATASYWLGDYATAWRYVKLEKQYGGKTGKQFLKMLKAKMPEPKT
jgi:tetratricopeptide (TPR) repeat protein